VRRRRRQRRHDLLLVSFLLGLNGVVAWSRDAKELITRIVFTDLFIVCYDWFGLGVLSNPLLY